MNAIALKKENGNFKIIDPHKGQEDIKKKIILKEILEKKEKLFNRTKRTT